MDKGGEPRISQIPQFEPQKAAKGERGDVSLFLSASL
jgi:hypothetical protein